LTSRTMGDRLGHRGSRQAPHRISLVWRETALDGGWTGLLWHRIL